MTALANKCSKPKIKNLWMQYKPNHLTEPNCWLNETPEPNHCQSKDTEINHWLSENIEPEYRVSKDAKLNCLSREDAEPKHWP